MKASIIIVAWNGIDYLGPCLDSVLKQDTLDFEVIVVDNGSTDGSADFVAEHYPQVQLIRNSQNLGFAGGNNIGLRAASGAALVLLNQDTVVHENWLAALLTPLDDPTVGMVGCKMLYPDGRIQHAGAYIVDARGTPEHIGRYEDDAGQYDEPRDLECVTAAGVALRRSTLARVGPLDEGFYPAYFEDTDWCYRVREAGLRVVYWPDAVLTHYESTSIKEIGYAEKVIYHHGRLRFLFKHKPLDWLQDTLYPAEFSWAESLGRTVEMMAARDAYLRLWLTLPEIFEFRCRLGDSLSVGLDPEEEWAGLVKLVTDLRALCARPLQ
ncbi:MAG: glycosyltransferase family 2 protein, partial [Anaerolineae bacterium]|nr:glycosyltransferase family 2 protein [Anaerolineae bacterium]